MNPPFLFLRKLPYQLCCLLITLQRYKEKLNYQNFRA
nr:MAG TPA: hypothetical protein [Caudoviricetes sp.]